MKPTKNNNIVFSLGIKYVDSFSHVENENENGLRIKEKEKEKEKDINGLKEKEKEKEKDKNITGLKEKDINGLKEKEKEKEKDVNELGEKNKNKNKNHKEETKLIFEPKTVILCNEKIKKIKIEKDNNILLHAFLHAIYDSYSLLLLKKLKFEFFNYLQYDMKASKYHFNKDHINFLLSNDDFTIDMLIFIVDYFDYDLFLLTDSKFLFHDMMKYCFISENKRDAIVIYIDDNVFLCCNERRIFPRDCEFINSLRYKFMKEF